MYVINSINEKIDLKNRSNNRNEKMRKYNNKRKSNIKRYK